MAPITRVHAVNDATRFEDKEDGDSSISTASENAHRRDQRTERQARTRIESAEMLRRAMRLAGVSQRQFADWIGIAKSGIDLILAAERSLAADDLLTPHPGVRRVAVIYLQLCADRLGGDAPTTDRAVPVRERLTLALETLGLALRIDREAMADGVLGIAEARELDELCTRAIDLVTKARSAIRAAEVSR